LYLQSSVLYGIPAKIVKASKSVIALQLSTLINITVDTGVFPDRLKKAQVTPLFKKNVSNI
jgi:hypothetical protein